MPRSRARSMCRCRVSHCLFLPTHPPLSRGHRADRTGTIRPCSAGVPDLASTLLLRVAALWFVLLQAALAAEPRNVLVLYSNNRLVPGNVAVDRGLRAALTSSAERPVQFFSEFLDRPEFSGAAYEKTMTTYLHDKYAARPPDVIVSVADDAVEFLARNRAELFPGIPVVHATASQAFLRGLQPLPADIVGVPMEYDFAGTLALRLHPDATRVVVVTGSSARDKGWEARLRQEVPPLAGNRRVDFLAGASTAEVLRRLGDLGNDTVVFTPGYFQDRDGRIFNPRDAAGAMAAASKAPVYGPFDTFIGTGVVGGMMPSFEAMGREAGTIVNRLFAGAAPASLQLPAIMPTALQVDWRQVRRWGIDDADIPAVGGVDDVMRMSVAAQEHLQAQQVRRIGAADQHRAAGAGFDQGDAAQDQRPNDALAEIRFRDDQRAQL